MLEVYKRSWQVFFPLFGAFVLGAIQTYIFFKDPQIAVTIILLILAAICLIIGIIAFVYDIKDALRKDREKKREASYKALVESFKHLGLDDKGAEIAATGRPPNLPIDGED